MASNKHANRLTELVRDQIAHFEKLASVAAADAGEYRALASVLKIGLPLALARGLEV